MSTQERRVFVRNETRTLERFLCDPDDPDGKLLVGWRRSYRCDCGFVCRAPGDIFDHARACAKMAFQEYDEPAEVLLNGKSLPTVTTKTDERRCGACTECCRMMAVPTLGKRADTPCEHARSCRGCAIYATRPTECAAFRCQWLLSPDALRLADRPDRLGVMFDLIEHKRYGRCVLVYELRSGALLDGRVRELAERFGGAQLVLGVRRGDQNGIGFGLVMAGPAERLALLHRDLAAMGAKFAPVKAHG